MTGLILPLTLESQSQLLLEQFATFGKGFHRKVYRLPDAASQDPLFPYTAGSIGSGANTAVLREAARELGGFDISLGPGTPSRRRRGPGPVRPAAAGRPLRACTSRAHSSGTSTRGA